MDNKINVYIEIEKSSNIKYEYDKKEKKLVIDRILDEPFVYPYAYGYIPNTIADDNDELDVLIITDKEIKNDKYYDVYIIASLLMEDEKGMDEKILCVLEEDYDEIKDIEDLSYEIKDKIHYFFSNYKKKSINKWSKVIGFINKEMSMKLYNKFLLNK
jgi:inorganic pyrophosphatase